MKLKDILQQVENRKLEEQRKEQPELSKYYRRIPPLAMTQKLKDIYESKE